MNGKEQKYSQRPYSDDDDVLLGLKNDYPRSNPKIEKKRFCD